MTCAEARALVASRWRGVAPALAGVAMLAFGAAWVLLWLIGLNGFDGETGGRLLLAQALLAGVAVPAAALLAHSLDARLHRRGRHAAARMLLALLGAIAGAGGGVVVLGTSLVVLAGSP